MSEVDCTVPEFLCARPCTAGERADAWESVSPVSVLRHPVQRRRRSGAPAAGSAIGVWFTGRSSVIDLETAGVCLAPNRHASQMSPVSTVSVTAPPSGPITSMSVPISSPATRKILILTP
jgi:hypothetical protein